MPIELEIVTPERLAYSDTVDSVQLPGVEGELGVLPHHAPLVSMLGVGELRIRKGGSEESFAIVGGFLPGLVSALLSAGLFADNFVGPRPALGLGVDSATALLVFLAATTVVARVIDDRRVFREQAEHDQMCEWPVERLDDQLPRRRLLARAPPDAILGVVSVPEGWSEREGALERELTFDDFAGAIAFVNRLAELAEIENHHPDIAISYRRVTVRWTTHSEGGITDRDRELAGRTEELV